MTLTDLARSALTGALAIVWLSGRPAVAQDAAVPVPHLIQNNDLTNWKLFLDDHAASDAAMITHVHEAFERSLLYGAMPGVDAQSISVLYSTFPWWKSDLYSFADHDRFLRSLAYFAAPVHDQGYPGRERSPGRIYMESGHDFVADFLAAGLPDGAGGTEAKILDFRVNDQHYTYYYDIWRKQARADVLAQAKQGNSPLCDSKSPNYVDEYERWAQTAFTAYFAAFDSGRLDPALDGRCVGTRCISAQAIAQQCSDGSCVLRHQTGRCPVVTLNFEKPVVRQFKLMQMAELIGKYRPALFELDFDRFPQYFPETMAETERTRIMTAWLAEIRTTLGAIRPGLRIGMRVPDKIRHRHIIGIDLPAVASDHSVDYAILAMPYISDQQTEPEVDPRHTEMKILAETTNEIGRVDPPPGLDKAAGVPVDAMIEPVTAREFATAANLAYKRGYWGNALFNIQYYLEMGPHIPPLDPPRNGVACMAKPECAGQSDQEYTLSTAHYNLPRDPNVLPFHMKSSQRQAFGLELQPPAPGWGKAGLLRLSVLDKQAAGSADALAIHRQIAAALRVSINGVRLAPASGAGWPADTGDGPATSAYVKRIWYDQPPFTALFAVDPAQLRPGTNQVEITAGPDLPTAARDPIIVNFHLFLPAAR